VQASAITGIAAIAPPRITISGKFGQPGDRAAGGSSGLYIRRGRFGAARSVAVLLAFAAATCSGAAQGYLGVGVASTDRHDARLRSVLVRAVVMLADNRTIRSARIPIAWLGGGTTLAFQPGDHLRSRCWWQARCSCRARLGRRCADRCEFACRRPGRHSDAAHRRHRLRRRGRWPRRWSATGRRSGLAGKERHVPRLTIDVVAAILVGGIASRAARASSGGPASRHRLTMLGNIMLLLGIDAGMRESDEGLLGGGVLLSVTLLKARSA